MRTSEETENKNLKIVKEISDTSSFKLSPSYLSVSIENFPNLVILLFYQNLFLEKDREILQESNETNLAVE